MGRTLLVTNDFPPRPGGIQSFVHGLAVRQPADSIVVYCSDWHGSSTSSGSSASSGASASSKSSASSRSLAFDAMQPFPVIRESTSVLLPTRAVARRAAAIAKEYGCDTAWFGAAAPLGLLADGLRRHGGIGWAVAQTHGHEVGWAALPGARTALRRIARGVDIVTYLGEYTRTRLDRVLHGLTELRRLAPGVDTDVYHPGADGAAVRAHYRLGDRPVIVCVSRLVPRKGQDALIRVLPEVRRRVPGTALLLVGGGPYRDRLKTLAQQADVVEHVIFTRSVPFDKLPAHYAAGDVYAMPCRTRRRGLDVEGLGIVYLEASATGLPVIAGDSGGAPDAVRDGETGYVVGGRDRVGLVERLVQVLSDRELAARLGAAGRAWTEAEWRWDKQAERMATLLTSPAHTPRGASE